MRELPEPPALSLNLSRRLADGGLVPGARHQWTVFDPATLRNAPVTVDVGKRELVRGAATPIPAFRVEMQFAGLRTTSWITDTGEVVREESPLGLITVRETPEHARGDGGVEPACASICSPPRRSSRDGEAPIDEPRDVRRLRLRLDGADLSAPDLDGGGAARRRRRPRAARSAGAAGRARRPGRRRATWRRSRSSRATRRRSSPKPTAAVRGVTGSRARAERLTRHVNALLEKKPTVSLPSAREVLRTKVGDCNEHTALYVAMARALGIPARIAVGLVYIHGAFYYHAWPEVYLDEGDGRGLWLPVDPTLNQFPADATHLRLARGGLDKQAAILPLIGRLKMTVLDLELAPDSTPILVGRQAPRISARWRSRFPQRRARLLLRVRAPMIAIHDLVKRYGAFTAVDGVSLDVPPGEIHGFLGPNGAGKTTTLRMIAGLLKPTSGRILVNGHDLAHGARGGEDVARLHSRSPVHLREADRRRVPPLPRRPLRPGRAGIARARARDARAVRARRAGSTSWSRASRTA